MKNFLHLMLIVFVVLSCRETAFKKVPDSRVVGARLEIAKHLTEEIMGGMSGGNFYKLTTAEASPRMVDKFTKRVQKQSYKQISSLFGEYHSHEFQELWKPKDGSFSEIYRFKGQFASGAPVEIRTVLDRKGKLIGFFIKPW